MRRNLFLVAGFLSLCFLAGCDTKEKPLVQQQDAKPRMILTCDPECDDNNSLIRYLLHAADFQTEAIVLTSSEYHWKGDGKGTTQYLPNREYSAYGLKIGPQTEWRWNDNVISDALYAYESAYPNLKVHDPSYPTPEYLRSIYKVGNVEFEGEMSKDTEGSNLIKQIFLDDKPGPVFAMSWGGVNSIARALKSIEDEYRDTDKWDAVYKKVCDKVILSMSGNQDPTYPEYIMVSWPDIKTRRQNTSGINVSLGYHAQSSCPEQDTIYYSTGWYKKYISNIGPFGPLQRVWGDGKQLVKDDIFDCFGMTDKYTQQQLLDLGYTEVHPFHPTGSFLGEGDSGNFLNQMDFGLRAWENYDLRPADTTRIAMAFLGGESIPGKYVHRDAPKTPLIIPMDMISRGGRRKVNPSFPDYIPIYQNALAARHAWSATPNYADANHTPIVNGPLEMTAAAGETITLNAQVSDPDGDQLTLKWWYYPVGTYTNDAEVKIDTPAEAITTVTIPADAKSGQTLHFVIEATDDDPEIPLTRFLRTVVTVK
ncbi:MAG: DUF1593 domain-containing protein [Bacteroidaceae bacterium]|nr:DUF1593 domain-containing protein [Bacteroidaceae bacterium]